MKNFCGTTLFSAALLLAGAAQAQVYIAGSLAASRIKTQAASADATAYAIGIGYRIAPWLALEASFNDNGSVLVYSGTSLAPTSTPMEGGSGLAFAAIGTMPLSPEFSLLGKLGAQNLGRTWSGTRTNPSVTNLGWTSTVGAGVQHAIDRRISLRALIEHIEGKQGVDSVRLLSLGALYAF